jgi:ADP-heptose:LPS heptosyltransferase
MKTGAANWLRFGAACGELLPTRAASPPCLLVIKPGSLGDALLFTGALRALREAYPAHEICLVGSTRARAIWERSPCIDALWLLDESGEGYSHWRKRLNRLVFAFRVLRRRYDLVLFPFVLSRDTWAVELFHLVKGVRKGSLPEGLAQAHELDKTLAVLQAAGCAVATRRDIWPDPGLLEEERAWARGVLQAASRTTAPQNAEMDCPGRDLTLALCPGARFKCKDWGVAKYAQLLEQVASECRKSGRRLRVLLLGGAEDKAAAQEILESVGSLSSNVKNVDGKAASDPSRSLLIEDWTGRCSLHDSVALIEQSDICIGNDTFGLHAAIAVGTPSVVIMWGGDGDQWTPWGDPLKHRMVRSNTPCLQCGDKMWDVAHDCMRSVSVADCMSQVVSL